MSSDAGSIDPYRPPNEVIAEPADKRRPGGLTTICVLAIVLGALGLCTALMDTIGLLAGKQVQQALQPQPEPGTADEILEIQNEMQDDIEAVSSRYWLAGVLLLLFHISVAMLLLVGGLQALRLKTKWRVILMLACGLAIVFEVSRATVQSMSMLNMAPVFEEHVPKILTATPGNANPREAQEMARIWVPIALAGIFIAGGALVLVKLVYYALALFYLNRSQVKALFQSKP